MTWTDALTAFAAAFPGFEDRPHQTRLAETIERALAAPCGHLLAQAGTGTGKSFAGLVPAIDKALQTGKPVIVATATKALQGQYVQDLQTLQKTYRPFTFALLKGRSNYLCKAKLADPATVLAFSDADALAAELATTETGDFDDLSSLHQRDIAALSTSSEECSGADCPLFEQCFATQAKKKAQQAQVVVVNHAVLAIDSVIRGPKVAPGTTRITADGQVKEIGWAGPLLPHHSALIIDEAHELAEYVTSALGVELRQAQVDTLLDNALDFVGRGQHDAYQAARTEVTVLYSRLADLVAEESTRALSGNLIVELGDTIAASIAALNGMRTAVYDVVIDYPQPTYDPDTDTHHDPSEAEVEQAKRQVEAKKRLVKRFDALIQKLTSVIVGEFDELVRWVERSSWTDKRGVERSSIVLKTAPLSVAHFLQTSVWAYTPSVLLSATLALGGDFSFIAEQVGFTNPLTFDAGTPFDYASQARTYVPRITSPSDDRTQWLADVAEHTAELVEAADGRALLLFTSNSALTEAHRVVAPKIAALGHKVLKQGELPASQLRAIFKADEHSVLFATRSFFTGVDIQGDSLRLVIIDRLPFANPKDVLTKARADLWDAKHGTRPFDNRNGRVGSFFALSLPQMALTLIQGQGRLIRTRNDAGVFALLDPRAVTKGYGKTILAALPPAPIVSDLDAVTSYLRDLDVDADELAGVEF